jgi:gluconolactonase
LFNNYPWKAPEALEPEMFSELPEKFRRPNGNFLEGPSFDRAGNLYCVDIPASRIYRISPAGDWEIAAEYDGEPNGLKIHRDGRLFIADRRRGIVVIDPVSRDVSFICEGPEPGRKFIGPNDLIFAANGDLYFTDQGRSGLQNPNGCIYRIADGSTTPERLLGNIPSPNGLVLNLKETELYFAVTRTNSIWKMEVNDPEKRTALFVQMPMPGPDGLALDTAGNVLVAQAMGGVVFVYAPNGAPLYTITPTCGDIPTNLAYGGDDMRDLYFLEARANVVLKVRTPVPGKPMFGQS